MWAAERIGSHHLEKVIFETEASEMVGAAKRLKARPSFRAFGVEIREALSRCKDWERSAVSRVANKCAFLIAKSVTSEQRVQSYVASGAPFWLKEVIEVDRCRALIA